MGPPVLCGLLTSILYRRMDSYQEPNLCWPRQAWSALLSVGLAGGRAWHLSAWALYDWLTGYPKRVIPQEDFLPNSIFKKKWKNVCYNSLAEKPFSSIKKSESGSSSAWLEKVQHCWARMAFRSGRAGPWCCGFWTLVSLWEEAFYHCTGQQIGFPVIFIER